MANPQHPAIRPALLARFIEAAATAASFEDLQQVVVDELSRARPYYSWTGFYMLDPNNRDTLVLGPFVGDPTPHIRIPLTEGICGAAVATGDTVVVDDVNADSRYLSCSIKTKSEIVVPIYANEEIIGEIDIDSHEAAAFTVEDRTFLEDVAQVLGGYVEQHRAAL